MLKLSVNQWMMISQNWLVIKTYLQLNKFYYFMILADYLDYGAISVAFSYCFYHIHINCQCRKTARGSLWFPAGSYWSKDLPER